MVINKMLTSLQYTIDNESIIWGDFYISPDVEMSEANIVGNYNHILAYAQNNVTIQEINNSLDVNEYPSAFATFNFKECYSYSGSVVTEGNPIISIHSYSVNPCEE